MKTGCPILMLEIQHYGNIREELCLNETTVALFDV